MTWHDVGALADFPEGGAVIVTAGSREIGVFHLKGSFYALMNRCSHAGAPICQGRVSAPIRSDGPGQPIWIEEDTPTIRCPWHHWEFSIRTGESVPPVPRPKIRTYPVKTENERVFVDV